MNVMENAKPLIDYDKVQTPAERRNNVLIQLIRDAAIKRGLDDVLDGLSERQADVQSHTMATEYALELLGTYAPSAEQHILHEMRRYAEYEQELRRQKVSLKIRKIFREDAYYMSSLLESDDDYGPNDPIADVVSMDDYLIGKVDAQVYNTPTRF